jgi:hypothetical protein
VRWLSELHYHTFHTVPQIIIGMIVWWAIWNALIAIASTFLKEVVVG